eukprot:Pgem_evm1s3218
MNIMETPKKSRALYLLERMNLANALMLAKSQYSMNITFIPDKLLQRQQKITIFFTTNNQFTQDNIKTPKNRQQYDQSHNKEKFTTLSKNFNTFSPSIQQTILITATLAGQLASSTTTACFNTNKK